MDNNTNDILEMELSTEQSAQLAETLQAWKEETLQKLEEEAEQKVQAKLDELEEQANAYKEEVAEAYSEKFLEALNEMREDVKAEVLAESVNSDPSHKVMEEIIRLVTPLMNESYEENTYMSEIRNLSERLAEYEHKDALAEGKATLEELIEGYDDSFKPALRALIGEGTSEEVTSRFEKMVESLNENNSEDEEIDDFEEEEEDFEDDDFDFEDEVENEEEETDEFSSINEEFEDDQDNLKPRKGSALRNSMMKLV